MKSQKELTLPEALAELSAVSRENSKLKAQINIVNESLMLAKNKINNLQQQARNLRSKVEESEKTEPVISFENSDQYIISEQVLNCISENDPEKFDKIAGVIVKLFGIKRFWAIVKNQSIESITTILQGMTTDKGFNAVIQRIKLTNGITAL